MAIQSHLEVLNNGVETWNGWRLANKELKPDLSISIVNLQNANSPEQSECHEVPSEAYGEFNSVVCKPFMR